MATDKVLYSTLELATGARNGCVNPCGEQLVVKLAALLDTISYSLGITDLRRIHEKA